jgi:hypothetical protein
MVSLRETQIASSVRFIRYGSLPTTLAYKNAGIAPSLSGYQPFATSTRSTSPITRLMASDNESMIVHTGGPRTTAPKRALEQENDDANKRPAKRLRTRARPR